MAAEDPADYMRDGKLKQICSIFPRGMQDFLVGMQASLQALEAAPAGGRQAKFLAQAQAAIVGQRQILANMNEDRYAKMCSSLTHLTQHNLQRPWADVLQAHRTMLVRPLPAPAHGTDPRINQDGTGSGQKHVNHTREFWILVLDYSSDIARSSKSLLDCRAWNSFIIVGGYARQENAGLSSKQKQEIARAATTFCTMMANVNKERREIADSLMTVGDGSRVAALHQLCEACSVMLQSCPRFEHTCVYQAQGSVQ